MNHKMSLASVVGQKIRKQREALGFTQEGFAVYVKIDRSNYGGIERGANNISIYTLGKIALALKVNMWDLLPDIKELSHLLK